MGHDKMRLQIGLYDEDIKSLSIHIKTHIDYIELVTKSLIFVLLYSNRKISKKKYTGELVIHYDAEEISRVFLRQNDIKIVSFRLPFAIKQKSKDSLEIYFFNRKVDHYILSKLQEINNYFRENIKSNSSKTLIDAYRDIGNDNEEKIDDYIYHIYNHILISEPGYLRYDYDIKNADGQKHPLHHIDINYDILGSYKYGLYHNLTMIEFENIFIKHHEKLYLHKYNDLVDFILPPKSKKSKKKIRKALKAKNKQLRNHPIKG